MEKISNRIITQVALLLLILLLLILIGKNLSYFIPGVLGAITLYILFRNFYNRLVEEKNWAPWLASTFIIIASLISLAIPLWAIVEILIPQVDALIKNTPVIIEKFNAVKEFMASKPVLRNINLSEGALMSQVQKIAGYIPKMLNSIAAIFANIATAFFILYFMQINSRNMERRLAVFLPFSQENVQDIWAETKMMVRSNALGIPLLAICQGIVAIIGYWIFGVNNFFLWGILTGVASVIPVVGTMVIWVPVCIVVFATGEIGRGIGLTLYCLIAVGGIDNVLRFTILKKIGDVHPLITVFGVILGLNLFGMMGLIFGPLLLSYFILLTKVYRTEFGKKQELVAAIEQAQLEKQEEVLLKNVPSKD
ncbi:AI-2E family transporter [Haoranjiania flava]|uniref:AI-2E family transporter n=1 Tax=Haoranjiania flava TaxID=1856322 RepID=A0AAE3IJS9_9BACT|nr:AI-2E family transporter [Haoranjiania flava]MCU7693004.1 AI-2E family transporter [Haoranjiania flava]